MFQKLHMSIECCLKASGTSDGLGTLASVPNAYSFRRDEQNVRQLLKAGARLDDRATMPDIVRTARLSSLGFKDRDAVKRKEPCSMACRLCTSVNELSFVDSIAISAPVPFCALRNMGRECAMNLLELCRHPEKQCLRCDPHMEGFFLSISPATVPEWMHAIDDGAIGGRRRRAMRDLVA